MVSETVEFHKIYSVTKVHLRGTIFALTSQLIFRYCRTDFSYIQPNIGFTGQ